MAVFKRGVGVFLIAATLVCGSCKGSDNPQPNNSSPSKTPHSDQVNGASSSSSTRAANSGAPIEQNKKKSVPLREDDMHICACAGEYMWMSLVAKKMYSADDPRYLELEKIAFWYQRQAGDIVGEKRAIAMSMITAEKLSAEAKEVGMQQVAVELLMRTSDCQPLIMRLKPETTQCFIPQPDARVGFSYKFVCGD
jgi:hypothetical protein